ncbi:hypothetical protein WKI68_31230 [Streptomyces sp. MS1.HAVA.3]|uniref:Uncharacterized protein n=1 Tax=Streptomyces caledonius TaxID=3134107 RepID=A0ABU8UA76_9ACTN
MHTAGGDPVRTMLGRRLTQLLEDEPADVVERLGMLTADLTEELGAHDALTVRAAYHRAMRVRGRSGTELERILPRMVRVLGWSTGTRSPHAPPASARPRPSGPATAAATRRSCASSSGRRPGCSARTPSSP